MAANGRFSQAGCAIAARTATCADHPGKGTACGWNSGH